MLKIGTAEELGRRIRQRRKELGATLAQASGLAGVGIRFLSELERGKASAELGKTLRVLQRLGLDVWIAPRGSKPEAR